MIVCCPQVVFAGVSVFMRRGRLTVQHISGVIGATLWKATRARAASRLLLLSGKAGMTGIISIPMTMRHQKGVFSTSTILASWWVDAS